MTTNRLLQIGLLTLLSAAVAALTTYLVPPSKAQLQGQVETLLREEPALILEGLKSLREQQMQDQQKQQQNAFSSSREALFSDETDPVLGDDSGTREVVYFTDYNCPFCRKIEPSLEKLIRDIDGLKLIVKPVGALGQDSTLAAQAVIAALQRSPAAFADLHHRLMGFPKVNGTVIAREFEQVLDKPMDREQLQSATQIGGKVAENLHLMQKLGIRGTPALVFTDGTVVPGALPYEQLRELFAEKFEE